MVKKVGAIPDAIQKDGIKWLNLEHGVDTLKGFFIYLHESLEEEATFDEWYSSQEKAERAAKSNWGVEKEDWFIPKE